MMNFRLVSVAATALALIPVAALALVDNYSSSHTTLSTVQDGFAIEVRDAGNLGKDSTVRVYVRPRNGNCVTANANPVTQTSLTLSATNPLGLATLPKLHDNPMCESNKWGYFYTVPESSSYVIHGTLKSYKIELTRGEYPAMSGQYMVTRLRSN